MQNTIPYGPPPPPHLASRNTPDQLRPRWEADHAKTADRGVAPDVVMEDVTPPVTAKDLDPFALVEAEQSAEPRPVLPAPPLALNAGVSIPFPRSGVNGTQPRRVHPMKRPILPVNRVSGSKDSPNTSASANRSSSPFVAQPLAPPTVFPSNSAVPLFGSMAMDPATRSRITINPGRRSSTSGSDGESATSGGASKALPRMGMGTPTMNREKRASRMRESPVASGDLGLPLVAAVENGRAAAGPGAGNTTDGVAQGGSENARDAVGGGTSVPGPQESPTSDAAGQRKVRFTDKAPPPVNAAAMVPTASIGPGLIGGTAKSAAGKNNLDLSPFLKQYRSELEQQWVRMRDHENATTATVDRLTKEKDDLLTQHKRAEKEIITLKKQLVGAKVKITNLDKGWKVERESAEQARASVQVARAELEAAQGQVEATRKELEQRQAELDVALAEHKASAQVREQVRSTLDATVRKNETLEQGNKVLVQEILTLKKEAQARATEHAARISSIKADQELEVKPLRVNLETARRELFAARQKSAVEEKTMAELKREKEALSKKVEAQKSAEEAVARLNKELEDSTALLQKEKSTFADVVNDKNKQLSILGTAVQTARTKASTTTQELQKLGQESKDEAARFMKRNSELGKSVEDKEAQLAKLTADMERLQTTSQARVKENATLREKLAAQTGKLDEREQAYQALVKDVAALKRDAEQRKTTSETLQTQFTTLTANCRELEQEKQRLEANARQLEQDKERLEVDLALKSNTSPGKDEVEREMDAVAQRVRAEEEKKYAEEIARLKAENAMLSTKISSRVNDSVGASTPSPKSARTSSKRRHAEMDEIEKKQYAEKVGETFFDLEGICIACRHTRKPDQPPVTPMKGDKQARVEHVLQKHGGILPQFREETRKVSKRHKRATSAKSEAGTPKSGRL